MTILNCSKMVSQLETQTIETRVDAVWSRWQAAMGTRAQLAMGVNIWIIKVLWHSPLALAWRFKMLVLFDRVITNAVGEVDLLKLVTPCLWFCLDESLLSIVCLCPLHIYFIFWWFISAWTGSWGTPLVLFVGTARVGLGVLHATKGIRWSHPHLKWVGDGGSNEKVDHSSLVAKRVSPLSVREVWTGPFHAPKRVY